MNSQLKDPIVIEAGLQFLYSTSIDSRAVKLISQAKGVQLCSKICETYTNERLIAEMNARVIYVLCYEDNNSEYLSKKEQLTLINNLMVKRYQWKTMQLYYLKSLNIIAATESESIQTLKKINVLTTIIATLQEKDYGHILKSILDSRSDKDEDFDEDEEIEENSSEKFSKAQYQDLLSQGVQLINKIITPEDITVLLKDLSDHSP